MKNYRFWIVNIVVIISIISALQLFSYAEPYTQWQVNSQAVEVPIPSHISFAKEPVPLHLFYVREALEQELVVNTFWHSSTIMLLKRSQRWLPIIDSILLQYKIPADFKYLCVAESGLKNVVSPAGAAGFWQIMKGTGREYGLEVNADIDERYKLEKATRVACEYLHKAYAEFGSWTLAAASYNAGMNKIRKEITRQAEHDYYRMNFREETARYVFRILALKQLLKHPDLYGFSPAAVVPYEPWHIQHISIDTTVHHLGQFAQQMGVSYRELKYYNPWLRTSRLPNKSGRVYEVAIPKRR